MFNNFQTESKEIQTESKQIQTDPNRAQTDPNRIRILQGSRKPCMKFTPFQPEVDWGKVTEWQSSRRRAWICVPLERISEHNCKMFAYSFHKEAKLPREYHFKATDVKCLRCPCRTLKIEPLFFST